MTLGEKIKKARLHRYLNQKQLAEKLEISPTRLNYWEKDKRQPDISMLKRIADVLDITGDYLIGQTDTINEYGEIDEDGDNLIGKRVRAKREALGYTVDEFAEHSGIFFIDIKGVESGRTVPNPDSTLIMDLSKSLDVSQNYLLGWQEEGSFKFEENEYQGDRLRKIRLASGRSEPETAEALKIPLLMLKGLEENELVASKEMRLKYSKLFGINPYILTQAQIYFTLRHAETLGEEPLERDDFKTLIEIEEVCSNLNRAGLHRILEYAKDLSSANKYRKFPDTLQGQE